MAAAGFPARRKACSAFGACAERGARGGDQGHQRLAAGARARSARAIGTERAARRAVLARGQRQSRRCRHAPLCVCTEYCDDLNATTGRLLPASATLRS